MTINEYDESRTILVVNETVKLVWKYFFVIFVDKVYWFSIISYL
jgi:hypothetical protein